MGGVEALRTAYGEKRHADAWAGYRRLVALGEATAEAHLVGSRAAKAMGALADARRAVEAAAAAGPTGAILGQVRFHYGTILREVGENQAAIDQLQVAIAGAHAYPELESVLPGPAWYNLGLALRQARRYPEAIEAYKTAIDHFAREHMETYHCMALHNLAWVACLVGDRTLAMEALDEARPHCRTEYMQWHQRLGEAFAAGIGDGPMQREAMETCQQILSAPAGVPDSIRSHACWLASRLTLNLGLLKEAEDLALQAVNHGARAQNENRCLQDGADLLRKVRLQLMGEKPAGSA